jgi:hypothetical protein
MKCNPCPSVPTLLCVVGSRWLVIFTSMGNSCACVFRSSWDAFSSSLLLAPSSFNLSLLLLCTVGGGSDACGVPIRRIVATVGDVERLDRETGAERDIVVAVWDWSARQLRYWLREGIGCEYPQRRMHRWHSTTPQRAASALYSVSDFCPPL